MGKSLGDIWFVYIVKCSDNSLYTGITNNIDKRIEKHNNGTGAKYCRGRGPVVLQCFKIVFSRPEALKLEFKVKKKNKNEKVEFLINYSFEMYLPLM